MEMFTKKSLLQKITIIVVIVLLFNFIAPNISMAKEDWGGVLFTPIQGLILGLGDATMYIIASTIGEGKVDNIITISTETLTQKWTRVFSYISSGGITWMLEKLANTIDKNVSWINIPKEIIPDKIDLPFFSVTPEKIFANEVPFLDINIISPNYTGTATSTLQPIISSWYISLRNLALVGMLSILVYIGIRILVSSTAADKAKYKQHIMDWLIAICLLFFIHYIMSFAITIVEELTKALKDSISIPVLNLDLSDYELSESQVELLENMGNEVNGEGKLVDKSNVKWVTDFTGVARFKAQLNYENAEDVSNAEYVANGVKAQMAYTLIYAVLVIYTVMFLFQYLKRLIYIIFLTMIAPLVAFTYPIDKMNDGSAQAFNTWLKEYIYNLLIQPFHLLLYCALIGSAIELASNYLLYTVAVLGFMLPAEKILRKFFGFEKGGTGASIMNGAVGGAMVMNAINNISSKAKGGAKKVASGGKSGGDGQERVRMNDRSSSYNSEQEDNFLMSALGGVQNNQNNSNTQGQTLNRREIEEGLDDDGRLQAQLLHMGESDEDDGEELARQIDRQPIGNGTEGIEEGLDDDGRLQAQLLHMGESDEDELQRIEYPTQREPELRAEPELGRVEQPENEQETKPKAIKGPVRAALPMLGKGALKAGKGLAKAYGAATLGMLGVAGGLASEDYGNVLKYGAAGAVAGSATASALMNKGKSLPSDAYRKVLDIKDEYMKNKYEDDKDAYKQYKNEQADKAFMNDKKTQQLYRDKFSKKIVDDGHGKKMEEWKLAMEKAKKYREHGITDNDVIIKAMKAKVQGVSEDKDASQRIAAAKYARNVQNAKDIQTFGERLKERGIGQEQIEKQKDLLRQIRDVD